MKKLERNAVETPEFKIQHRGIEVYYSLDENRNKLITGIVNLKYLKMCKINNVKFKMSDFQILKDTYIEGNFMKHSTPDSNLSEYVYQVLVNGRK